MYTLVDNIVRILFKLGFRIILIRGQKLFSDCGLIYHNINEKLEIVYNCHYLWLEEKWV